jgi:hypothetical protein
MRFRTKQYQYLSKSKNNSHSSIILTRIIYKFKNPSYIFDNQSNKEVPDMYAWFMVVNLYALIGLVLYCISPACNYYIQARMHFLHQGQNERIALRPACKNYIQAPAWKTCTSNECIFCISNKCRICTC